MKTAYILAGTAALAMVAGSAAAQSTTLTTVYPFTSVGGTAGAVSATAFTLSANVANDCSFYTGGDTAVPLNLGTLDIYNTSTLGLANAFKMTPGVRTVEFRTDVAGCNYATNITVAKTDGADGMNNPVVTGFDAAQFQNTIPYSIKARYIAGPNNSTAATPQELAVGTTSASATAAHGAWKSQMNIVVDVPAAAKALVAGSYSDTFTVTLGAI